MVVGDDWWLERHEYDGSEWWEFKRLPSPILSAIRLPKSLQDSDEWKFRSPQHPLEAE